MSIAEDGTKGRLRERFGQIAVRKGYVSPEDVQAALSRQGAIRSGGAPHKLIGMILLEMGILGTTELIDILRDLSTPAVPPRAPKRVPSNPPGN